MPFKGGFPTPINFVILGVIAVAAYPQLAGVTNEAMVNTLNTNLNVVRRVVEVYFVQHDNKYPGETTAADGIDNTDESIAAADMVKQLTLYSDSTGKVSNIKSNRYQYGPYLKGPTLPTNPFNKLNTVVCNSTNDIAATRTANSSVGWVYHFRTGIFYAADHVSY